MSAARNAETKRVTSIARAIELCLSDEKATELPSADACRRVAGAAERLASRLGS